MTSWSGISSAATDLKLSYGQIKGFTLCATRTIMAGQDDELIELAQTNLHELETNEPPRLWSVTPNITDHGLIGDLQTAALVTDHRTIEGSAARGSTWRPSPLAA
jgi:hypothetical protein